MNEREKGEGTIMREEEGREKARGRRRKEGKRESDNGIDR